MKFFIVFSIILLLFTSVKTFAINNNPGSALDESFHVFGAKSINSRQLNPAKRDLSLSYAATNIDSKEGTRVKTITVIKNHTSKKSDKLGINHELHKNEEWATAFRDNFDSYGSIPDVPDIDDLFDFVNKKKPKEKTDEGKKSEAPKRKEPPKEVEKPVAESPAEKAANAGEDVKKIKGDAELVPNLKSNNKIEIVQRSQSLSSSKREPLIDVNYSTPQHSVHQYFEKYIQETPSPKQQQQQGYEYSKPCPKGTKTSISVTQQSGRTYDIPVGNQSQSGARPYIAPAIAKKTQPQQPQDNSQNFSNSATASGNRPSFSVNSILPALQPTPIPLSQQSASRNVVNTTVPLPPRPPQTLQQGGGGGGGLGVSYSTSQRPYVAPNFRNGFGMNRAVPLAMQPIYRNDPSNFRTNAFGLGFGGNRVNTGRSRGIKY